MVPQPGRRPRHGPAPRRTGLRRRIGRGTGAGSGRRGTGRRGTRGEDVRIRPPLNCDFGYHIRIGARTFVNFNAVFLDAGPITIGTDVQIGPNVQLLTPTHELDPERRRAGWEKAEPVTIGDNVWLGGGVVVCPGASVGADTVVGAGSVVTKDLPPGVLAVGNPARVVRKLR
ncbi:sugar O-acetyltransferase [Streptomyces sp. NPDC017529]|uniref:sugar O-acetyltransferase n=1 Tax=Streptomyces sp. NPDC017529 TaxID=3365000 RepID=UPI0037B0C380